jgi:hypothetical protein
MTTDWPNEVLTDLGELRCQVTLRRYGADQCVNAATRTAVSADVGSPYLVIRVCEACANEMAQYPGWAVKL